MIYVGDTKYKIYAGSTSSKFHIAEPECFYIYHTNNNVIEKRYIKDNQTINFSSIAGNNYGGVFTDYGGKGSIAIALENGQYSSEGIINIVDDGTPYNGELNNINTKLFDSTNAITENTTNYTPQVGTIYYLKENPNWVLNPYNQFYPTGNNKWTYLFYITGIDGVLYNSPTLYIKEENANEYESINMTSAKSLKIGTATLRCGTVFRTKGCPTTYTGYLCYVSIADKVEAGKTYLLYSEIITLDGIVLHSPYIRKLTVQEIGKNMTAEDIPFDEI